MLCQECQKLKFPNLQQAQTKCFEMGFKDRIPGHEVNGEWMPGPTPKHLEDWCAKNCKPAKPAKPVEEKITIDSNKNQIDKDKKKD